MRAAITLASRGRVLVLTKGDAVESSTRSSQGGIAVAPGDDDEVAIHLHDTLRAGDGLCREDAVRILVEEGPRLIHELIEWGMRFDRHVAKLAFAREGARSRPPVLRAHGESTGSEILHVLMAKARSLGNIAVQRHACAVGLLIESGRVAGVRYLDEHTGNLQEARAASVLLATGGLGQVYKETTNPPSSCGDGVAMAYRAGALLSDLEFVQFHPTVLWIKGAPRFPFPESLRAEGGQLRNIDLERFMPRHHEAAELAPRDIVSRVLVMEMQRTGSEFNFLDLTALDPMHIKKRFPKVCSTCLEYNLDITTDLIPIRPAAHFAMGGVATDLNGATTLEGLYAAGEVAATGVHGANRLASNSLLEGLVFGARAADTMIAASPAASIRAAGHGAESFKAHSANNARKAPEAPPEIEQLACEVRCLMLNKAGIIRNRNGLGQAVARLDSLHLPACLPDRRHYEVQSLVEVARLIARSALAREESRGAHYRSDHPLKNETAPPRHSFLSKETSVYFE